MAEPETLSGPADRGLLRGVSWSWRYETPAGDGATSSPPFGTQSDAETWLGETFGELLEQDVHSVTLLDDDRDAYSMSLDPTS